MSNTDPFAELDAESPEQTLRLAVRQSLQPGNAVVTPADTKRLRDLQQKLGLRDDIAERIVSEEIAAGSRKRSDETAASGAGPSSSAAAKKPAWVQPAVVLIVGLIALAAVGLFLKFSTGQSSAGASTPMSELPVPSKGATGNAITMVEFADFECQHSKHVQATLDRLLQEYGGRIRLEFRHFPLTIMHPNAETAALAAVAAHHQGKFWQMHDKLFANQGALTRVDIERYADEIGLNMSLFRTDVESDAARRVLDRDQKAVNGLNGTPTFLVASKTWVQGNKPYDDFKAAVESALGGTTPSAGGKDPMPVCEQVVRKIGGKCARKQRDAIHPGASHQVDIELADNSGFEHVTFISFPGNTVPDWCKKVMVIGAAATPGLERRCEWDLRGEVGLYVSWKRGRARSWDDVKSIFDKWGR